MFGLEPENTIRAFKRAFELGLEYAECDIRYTKDKHLVIMHDATVDRTTNGRINCSFEILILHNRER